MKKIRHIYRDWFLWLCAIWCSLTEFKGTVVKCWKPLRSTTSVHPLTVLNISIHTAANATYFLAIFHLQWAVKLLVHHASAKVPLINWDVWSIPNYKDLRWLDDAGAGFANKPEVLAPAQERSLYEHLLVIPVSLWLEVMKAHTKWILYLKHY